MNSLIRGRIVVNTCTYYPTLGVVSYISPMPPKVPPTLDESLRQAIRDSGLSANQLARATEVPQPTITRFLNGADMKLSTASRLAAYLGLHLIEK